MPELPVIQYGPSFPGMSLKIPIQKGVMKKLITTSLMTPMLLFLLFESALHALPEGKSALGGLIYNPGFFPFQAPLLTADYITQNSDRINVAHYGLDDELLKLKV